MSIAKFMKAWKTYTALTDAEMNWLRGESLKRYVQAKIQFDVSPWPLHEQRRWRIRCWRRAHHRRLHAKHLENQSKKRKPLWKAGQQSDEWINRLDMSICSWQTSQEHIAKNYYSTIEKSTQTVKTTKTVLKQQNIWSIICSLIKFDSKWICFHKKQWTYEWILKKQINLKQLVRSHVSKGCGAVKFVGGLHEIDNLRHEFPGHPCRDDNILRVERHVTTINAL